MHMSTDYYISIHRKKDDKLIGKTLCNHLKSIFDSPYSNKIGCCSRLSADNISFTYDDLIAINDCITLDISKVYDKIFEKKLMIVCASNVDVKRDIEEDISSIEYDISDLLDVKDSVNHIIGTITTIVENQVRNPKKFGDVADGEHDKFNVLAYEYNAEDLNEGKGNSDAREHVWVDNVYCVVEAC
jgi:hypothetical protein